jgi:hypothetical protein
MKLENKTIYLISNEAWGPLWYSKHNYAVALSKQNTVVFIDPAPKYQIRNLFSANIELKKIKEDLFVLSYANVFPANQKFALLFWLNEFFVFRRI